VGGGELVRKDFGGEVQIKSTGYLIETGKEKRKDRKGILIKRLRDNPR